MLGPQAGNGGLQLDEHPDVLSQPEAGEPQQPQQEQLAVAPQRPPGENPNQAFFRVVSTKANRRKLAPLPAVSAKVLSRTDLRVCDSTSSTSCWPSLGLER